MRDKRLIEIVANPRSWGTAKHLLNTWALSGSSYGLVVNLLVNASLCGAMIFSEKDYYQHSDDGKYILSTSILSSATLIGFTYLAPMTLASLAVFVAADSIIRGALAQLFFSVEPNLQFRNTKDTCETFLAKYLLINGTGSGILSAIITASSIMALTSTSSFALPIAVASHLLKAAVEFNEARHNKWSRNDAQLFLNRAVSSVGSLAILSGMVLLNPMPTFGLAALYFLADGAMKTYCDGMAIFDKPAIPGVTPSLVRA